jgi:hypothetical protein
MFPSLWVSELSPTSTASFSLLTTQSESYVMTNGQSASMSWCQAPIWGPSDSCGFVDVDRPLWQEDRSVIYNCCWPSSVQSFLGLSPAGLMTFYCLRFETPPTWRARFPYLYPPGTGWPSYTIRHWVPFSSPPTTHRAMVDVFKPTFTWEFQLTQLD